MKIYQVTFAIGFLIGLLAGFLFYNPSIVQQDHTYDQVTKSITVEQLFTPNEIDSMGGTFSGFVVVSTESIAYWTSSDAIFVGFQVGKTYCVKAQPNLPQGPIINQNLGLGECK